MDGPVEQFLKNGGVIDVIPPVSALDHTYDPYDEDSYPTSECLSDIFKIISVTEKQKNNRFGEHCIIKAVRKSSGHIENFIFKGEIKKENLTGISAILSYENRFTGRNSQTKKREMTRFLNGLKVVHK